MSKNSLWSGLGLGLLAVAAAAGEALAADERQKREQSSIGMLTVPSYKLGELRDSRIIVSGSRIEYVSRSSYFGTTWPLPWANFRAFGGAKISKIEIEDASAIAEGALLRCSYAGPDGRWRTGYINVHVTN